MRQTRRLICEVLNGEQNGSHCRTLLHAVRQKSLKWTRIRRMEAQANGGEYGAYCPQCKAVRAIRRDELQDGVVELVCEVCYAIIATLYR